MLLTILLKLKTNPEQKEILLQTMERFNQACNFISEIAFENRAFSRNRLHHLSYYPAREKFGLTATFTIKAISKIVDSYKKDRKELHTFKPRGAIIYNYNSLSFKNDMISISTLEGRLHIPFVNHKQIDTSKLRREANLIYRNGEFYLAVPIEVEEKEPYEPQGWLGVDLGIVNIASDSEGEVFSGAQVNGLRKRYAKLRSKLQKKAAAKRKQGKRPKSLLRLLKRRSRKEHNFASNINHIISKKLVAKALRHRWGIALEDLKGIRQRITASRAQRRTQHSWAFYQLRSFIEYKAKLAGVPVVFVKPNNTSRTCPVCGCIDKRNRKSQSEFHCVSCGFAGPADIIAARNIACRATTLRPYAAGNQLRGEG